LIMVVTDLEDRVQFISYSLNILLLRIYASIVSIRLYPKS